MTCGDIGTFESTQAEETRLRNICATRFTYLHPLVVSIAPGIASVTMVSVIVAGFALRALLHRDSWDSTTCLVTVFVKT